MRNAESNQGVNDDETLDRTPWPVNRMSYQDLKVAELDAVEKLFVQREDTPLLMKWVMQHTQGGTFRKRLIVISALRVWLLRRKKPMRTTVECVGVHQLIHVTKVVVMRGSSMASEATVTCVTTPIKLYFASSTAGFTGGAGDVEFTTLHIDPGAHSESIARLLQRQLHTLRLAFPLGMTPPVCFPPNCHWKEFFDNDSILAISARSHTSGDSAADQDEQRLCDQFTAISAAYRAFCDDLRAPYRESVITRFEECIRSLSCVDFQYCLALPAGGTSIQQTPSPEVSPHNISQQDRGVVGRAAIAVLRCIGLGPPSSIALLRRETQALVRALEHADCAENIVVRQLEVSDAGMTALFKALLSPASTIQGLALQDVRLSASALRIFQNIVLQSTIKHERDSQSTNVAEQRLGLRRLDLSFNQFSQEMSVELAVTLELLPLGLELLQLERCALSEAASCLLLSSIGANAAFSRALRELNLSGNHLGREGTQVLASWLTGAFALGQLDVSRTALDLNCFCLALQQNSILSESALAHLDISYNRMRSRASQALGLVLGKTRSLATLVLRGMTRFHIAWMTVRRRHNSFGGSMLPQRRMKLGVPIGLGRAQHTRGLKSEHLHNILSPMFANTGRVAPCVVDLSENNLSGKKAELLAQLLDASPTIARQCLRLDYTCLHDKASLLLLHSIRGCSTVHSLSLESNGVVKRSTQRKRLAEEQPIARVSRSAQESHANYSSLEQAAARALSLLVGGRSLPDTNGGGKSTPPSTSILTGQSQPTPRLRELCLKSYSSFVFGSLAIAAVVDALACTSSLRVLDVSGNECGDALAHALGRALPQNSSLQSLFWDDNCTSVDGFFDFYAGLMPNRSLTMIQMPIQDTRRILEGQKDPPREKLFSVLGKIFKATERNQAKLSLAHQQVHSNVSDTQRADTLCKQPEHNQEDHDGLAGCRISSEQVQSQHDEKESKLDPNDRDMLTLSSTKCERNKLQTPVGTIGLVGSDDAAFAHDTALDPAHVQTCIPRCPSPDMASRARRSNTWRSGDDVAANSSVMYRARYASTMYLWDARGPRNSICDGGPCDSIDFTAQWNELKALTASFSTT